MKKIATVVISLLYTGLCFSQSVVDSTLIVYLPFDNSVTDLSPKPKPTQSYNTIFTTNQQNLPNGALAFNGSSSEFQVDSVSSKIFENDFTISCWVNFYNFTQLYPYIAYTDNYGIAIFGAGPYYGSNQSKIGFYETQIGGGQFSNTFTNSTLTTQNWYAFTLVRKNDSIYYYLNGLPQGSYFCPKNAIMPSNFIRIGSANGTDECLNGAIDEFRLYSRALSNLEVNQLITSLTNTTIQKTESLVQLLPTLVQDGMVYVKNNSDKSINIKLYNPVGLEVKEAFNPTELSVNNLPKGLYKALIKSNDGEFLSVQNIIVQ